MNDDRDLTPDPAERELAAEIRSLGDPRPDADFRARLRAGFVAGDLDALQPAAEAAPPAADAPSAAAPRRRRGRRLLWGAVPVALAAVLAVALLGGSAAWRTTSVRGDGLVAVGDAAAPAADAAAVAALLAGGGRVRLEGDAAVDLLWQDVVAVALQPGTQMVLPAAGGDRDRPIELAVDAGQVSLTTGPRFHGRTLRITTSEGVSVVTGTTVDVFKNAELTCVCVLEGVVEITDPLQGSDRVPAGMRKVMFADGRPPLIVPIAGEHAAIMEEFLQRSAGAFD